MEYNWDEPERAPHKREVCAACLSVYLSVFLSVRTFMMQKYTRVILIYEVPQLLIAAFMMHLVNCFVCHCVQQTCSEKQHE